MIILKNGKNIAVDSHEVLPTIRYKRNGSS